MDKCKTPNFLDLNRPNLSENFRKFKQNFEIYRKASGLEKKPDDVKVSILLNIIGEDSFELFNTFNLNETQAKDYQTVLKSFEDYFNPKKNVVIERFQFNSRSQSSYKAFDSHATDLKKLVKSCKYGDQTDSVLRDRIVLGINDKSLQERLLRVPELSLSKAVELCRASEMGKVQIETIQNKSKETYGLSTNKSLGTKPTHSSHLPTKTNNQKPIIQHLKGEDVV